MILKVYLKIFVGNEIIGAFRVKALCLRRAEKSRLVNYNY